MLIQSFSGIRGVYGKDLTDDIARRYAYVFNEFVTNKVNKKPKIVVGYDTRDSSEALRGAIVDSLFDIIDVGVMPVAAVELGVREYKADGGIMITASHNEPDFNGFKFLDKDGAVLRPNDMDKVISSFKKLSSLSEVDFLNNHLYKDELKGTIKKITKKHNDLIDKYCNFLNKIVGKVDNNVKVILDVNGGAGIILDEIIKKLNIDNIIIINDEKGEFKRKIEPNKESLKGLKSEVNKENAEFAAGFDSDADRVEILLKDGGLVDGNYLLALIVDDVLSKDNGVVVTNDATSNVVRAITEKHNCTVKEVEVGEINVVDKVLELDSPIGGEGSNGGVILPPSRCRDGILSILYLLNIINSKKRSLKELIDELPKYYTTQKKIKFNKKADNKTIKKKIKDYYSDKKYKIQETGDITGGLKIVIDKDTFVWFRFSKTEENLLRVIVDSDNQAETDRLLGQTVFLN
jgi:phosphomannomutase